jgi:PKD repeat protein
LIGNRQVQPAGGFERIRDTAEVEVQVQGCAETRRLCNGVATFGAHFRHAAGSVAAAGPAAPTGLAFVGSLSGANEVPANASATVGTVTAILNADATVTYSVASTGFESAISAAHVHGAPAGVVGPVLFPLDCRRDGTSCGGTSRPLDPPGRALLLAGSTYANIHTPAFPDGEIRGQLVPVTAAGNVVTAGIRKAVGKVEVRRSRRSPYPGAEMRLDGSFELPSGVALAASTGVVTRVLHEGSGAGELTRGADGQTLPPFALFATKTRESGEATLESGASVPYQGCRLRLRPRQDRVFDFSLQCRGSKEGATLSRNPAGCGERFESTAPLATELVLAGSSPVRVPLELLWRCLGRTGRLRELRTASGRGSSSGGSGPPGVEANRPPQADFRVSAGAGTAPLTVGFSNHSRDPDGTVVAYQWDFGDGRRSADAHPVHTFAVPGRFVVTLRVVDDRGTSSTVRSATISVSANSAPRAEFRADPLSGEAPLTVLFTNRSTDPEGRLASFQWDFGDGAASALENPVHAFLDPGTYVVALVARDDRGTPSAPRRQVITVREPGASTNRAPVADFRADPTRGSAPLAVRFTNRSSDPEDDRLAFLWDFGDGTRSTEPNPIHVYHQIGVFEATLKAIDARGQTSTPAGESIVVTANRAPIADFRADPRRGEAPLTVSFTNRSTDADGAVVGFEWDFGDGSTSRAENPVHAFTAPAKYAVTLSVTDDRGARSERIKRESIEAE